MTLAKTSILTAISTIVAVISAFIINKVVAVYGGPSGLALIGQLKDFVTMLTNISNGAISQGIVKYTAEYKEIEQKQNIFSTSIIISLICSIFISILLITFNEELSTIILNDIKYSKVFIVFGFTISLFALNMVLMSILNGQKEIKKFVFLNISNNIFMLLITVILIFKLNVMGALYALVLNQSITFFITIVFLLKSNWFKLRYFIQGIDKVSFFKLSKFSLMSIVSIIMGPLSLLLVRYYIGENLSWNDAGYWQGVWYISSIYLLLITTSLSVYYLPKLSEIQDKIELKNEIINGYKIILPIVVIMAIIVFILKEYIILIAFDKSFLPMLELFKWQLVGDVIKIASWLLSYTLIAKAKTKYFIGTEIIFSISFVLFSIMMIENFGLVGITYAFVLNYTLYLITMIIIIKKEVF